MGCCSFQIISKDQPKSNASFAKKCFFITNFIARLVTTFCWQQTLRKMFVCYILQLVIEIGFSLIHETVFIFYPTLW